MIFEKYIKGIYFLWARLYDKFVDPVFKFNRKGVIIELKIKKNDSILEVGVGTGLNLPFYPISCKVTGVDFSSAMLEKAKQKRSRVKINLQVADARSLPFAKNTFDKALTTYVLRVSPDPKKVLKEVSRVVKKGGKFVIVDQFKGQNSLLLIFMRPFKLLLGWGKEYILSELVQDTSWKIKLNKQYGLMENTRLVVMENKK